MASVSAAWAAMWPTAIITEFCSVAGSRVNFAAIVSHSATAAPAHALTSVAQTQPTGTPAFASKYTAVCDSAMIAPNHTFTCQTYPGNGGGVFVTSRRTHSASP